jgi:uncharacterized DUF497 family protein
VKIEFDMAKNHANIAKHGVDMAEAGNFEFDTALTTPDTRRSYGERRIIALGVVRERVHVLVFTMRGAALRVISLRKANHRETTTYHAKKKEQT